MDRFLDPRVLAGISSLDLLAKTVVDSFVAGLHRSTDFGFSQEFTEYRAYTPGDDLRHVDWNLYARTERCYLKRYRGETNTQLTILLDASNSMQYTSGPPTKMDYARYMAASLFYLAIRNQRDAAGLIVFDDQVREYIRPSTILVDLETERRIEVIPDYAKTTYRAKVDGHIEELRSRARAAGIDYQLLVTSQPLDAALREYLSLRKAGN
jgi:hypothetical protein